MYKFSTNSRRLLMNQSRRAMSTNTNATVRKSGLSKITLGALFVTAAGMAYYNNTGKRTTEKGKFFFVCTTAKEKKIPCINRFFFSCFRTSPA